MDTTNDYRAEYIRKIKVAADIAENALGDFRYAATDIADTLTPEEKKILDAAATILQRVMNAK